jgi:hypothetical protein
MTNFDGAKPQRLLNASGTGQRTQNANGAFMEAYAEMCRFVASSYSNSKSYRSILDAVQSKFAEQAGHDVLKLYPTNLRAVFRLRALGMIMSLPGGEALTSRAMKETSSSPQISLVSVGKWVTQPGLKESLVLTIIARSSTAEECALRLFEVADTAKAVSSRANKARSSANRESAQIPPESVTGEPMPRDSLGDGINSMSLLAGKVIADSANWTPVDAAAVAEIARKLQLAVLQSETET